MNRIHAWKYLFLVLGLCCLGTNSAKSQAHAKSYEIAPVHRYDFNELVRFTDLNNDGWPDLVHSYSSQKGGVRILFGGAEGFKLHQVILPENVFDSEFSIVVGDFSGDGLKDLLVTYKDLFSDYWTVYFELKKSGQFEKVSEHDVWRPNQVRTGDFNGDGRLDYVSAYYGAASTEHCSIYINDGNGRFEKRSEFPTNRQHTGQTINVGDFNRDGILDISLSTGNTGLDIYFGSQTLQFKQSTINAEFKGSFHFVSDFNNDNFLDIYQHRFDSADEILYLQNADGTFEQHANARVNLGQLSLPSCLIDYDGDGDDDFLRKKVGGNQITLLENQGNATFVERTIKGLEGTDSARLMSFLAVNANEKFILKHLEYKEADDYRLEVFRTQINSSIVNGRVFYNEDASCDWSLNSRGIENRLVEINSGEYWAVTREDGGFRAFLPDGSYSAKVHSLPGWGSSCDSKNISFQIPGGSADSEPLDFPQAAVQDLNCLSVSLISSRFRPGRSGQYIIEYENAGTLPFNGKLNLTYDDRLEFTKASVPVSNQGAGSAEWEITDLPVFGTGKIVVNLKVSRDAQRGDNYCALLETLAEQSSDDCEDARDEMCTEVTGGFDPNDIRVWPQGEGVDGQILPNVKTLSYMIRFQNTGNDTTFNVVVRDTLPESLDLRRLRFGAASHDYEVTLLEKNILEFTFADIYLPDSTTDLLGSQGFVKYRVDLKNSVKVGTQIRNRAGIYFDYNEVVLTNDAVTTIVVGSADVETTVRSGNLLSVPNPVADIVSIFGIPSDTHFLEVCDLQGRIVMRILTKGLDNLYFDCSGLAPAAYLVRTRGGADSYEVQINVVR